MRSTRCCGPGLRTPARRTPRLFLRPRGGLGAGKWPKLWKVRSRYRSRCSHHTVMLLNSSRSTRCVNVYTAPNIYFAPFRCHLAKCRWILWVLQKYDVNFWQKPIIFRRTSYGILPESSSRNPRAGIQILKAGIAGIPRLLPKIKVSSRNFKLVIQQN